MARKSKQEPAQEEAVGEQARGEEPGTNPKSNLIMADLALRGLSVIARIAVEKALLRQRYNPRAAKEILSKGPLGQRMLLAGAGRLAARSVPGALLVGGGILGKVMLDRIRTRRQAQATAASTEGSDTSGPDSST